MWYEVLYRDQLRRCAAHRRGKHSVLDTTSCSVSFSEYLLHPWRINCGSLHWESTYSIPNLKFISVMFLRKKPPQLSILEELQQTYTDVCNITIKNLDLEEHGKLEDALKGWKSLHTLLLFKIDLLEKRSGKNQAEEAALLSELKSIRDENVKHLVRVQLLIDEKNHRGKNSIASNQHASHSAGYSHNMSVPSLRSNNPGSRSLNSNNGPRQMMKSLRSTPSYQLPQQQRDAVKTAANISWLKPARSVQKPDPNTFVDFDQTEMKASTWDRLTSDRTPSPSVSASLSPNLIDLEGESVETSNSLPNLSKSLEDLSLPKKKAPPPPPPKRSAIQSESSRLSASPLDRSLLSPHATIRVASKSTPDIRTTGTVVSETKKYSYAIPKPINVQKIMQAQSTRSKSKVFVAKASAVQSGQKPKIAAKPVVKQPPPKVVAPKKKSNITYNYVPLNKSAPVKAKPTTRSNLISKPSPEETTPLSPTMDDIIGGYEETSNADVVEAEDGSMTPDEQKKLIESIRGIDELSANQILNDIVVRGDQVYWDDIVGLDAAKNSLKEAVVYPFLRPDLFRGLREPTRGMLLFGPPGTGKTMLARAVATESKSTFFSISSSSLTSKYLGESEKLVKALFLLARKLSPSIVFIDEIDSLLGTRTEGEVESMRRIKNEFLVQWSELSSAAAGRDAGEDLSRVLILGATNLPWGIDDAARRRFAKRVYIPLPEDETRRLQIRKLLAYQKNTLLEEDYDKLVELSNGFSGSDITLLAKDSAMGPLRSLGDKLLSTPTDQIRPIKLEDFAESLKYIRPSVSKEGLGQYEEWASKFGSSGA